MAITMRGFLMLSAIRWRIAVMCWLIIIGGDFSLLQVPLQHTGANGALSNQGGPYPVPSDQGRAAWPIRDTSRPWGVTLIKRGNRARQAWHIFSTNVLIKLLCSLKHFLEAICMDVINIVRSSCYISKTFLASKKNLILKATILVKSGSALNAPAHFLTSINSSYE